MHVNLQCEEAIMNRNDAIAPELMPILSAGRHRNAARGACFMEYASFLAGERWSDHPACTHPQLAALARDVNDLTSAAGRSRLVPLIPRVVGLYPRHERYAAEIALVVGSIALPIVSLERQRALGVGLLSLVQRVDDPRFDDRVRDAFDQAPDIERWARQYLGQARTPRGSWTRSAEATIHTSAVGIALACVSDADAYLFTALEAAIEAGERRMLNTTVTEERALVAS